MEEKLVIEMHRFENVLVGRILTQPESITRGIFRQGVIYSSGMPQLAEGYLYIRGTDSTRDNRYIAYAYKASSHALNMLRETRKEVSKINGSDLRLGDEESLPNPIIIS